MTKRVRIDITMTGAAFEDDPAELPRILRDLAYSIEDGIRPVPIDINGNVVGTVVFT